MEVKQNAGIYVMSKNAQFILFIFTKWNEWEINAAEKRQQQNKAAVWFLVRGIITLISAVNQIIA